MERSTAGMEKKKNPDGLTIDHAYRPLGFATPRSSGSIPNKPNLQL